MGRSRRKYKASRAKVQVGLPKRNPKIVKPAFNLPPKLRTLLDPLGTKWDEKGSVISNYKQFGFVSNPNLLGSQQRSTKNIIQSSELQVPPKRFEKPFEEFDELESSGSDLEEDDLKTALGKQRRDGKKAPVQPLTTMQREHIRPLVEKYGDDYEMMFRDIKLNTMQHSIATLKNLCLRYRKFKNKNPLL